MEVRIIVRLLCLLTLCKLSWSNSQKSYSGHAVLRVIPETEAHVVQLIRMQHYTRWKINYWQSPEAVGSIVDIQVPPESRENVERFITLNGMTFKVLVEDVQKAIDAMVANRAEGKTYEDFDWTRYHTLDEINTWLDGVVAGCADCEIVNVGKSYEGRDLKAIKISRPGSDRRAIWLDAGIHAREWVAPAVTTYFIDKLVSDYGTDDVTTTIRDKFDWYILPVVNPDGYQFTWDSDRLWRKTRQPVEGAVCIGTDGNRNFDFQWLAEGGASGNPCSQLYRGPSPASEPEIKSVSDFLFSMKESFDISFTIHSYTQVLIIPWGYTKDPVPDYDEMEEVAFKVRDAIEAVHDMKYEARIPNGLLSGNTMDWSKGVAEIKWSYLLELRDTGEHGFLLPPEQILPNAEEVWAGIKVLAQEVIERTPQKA